MCLLSTPLLYFSPRPYEASSPVLYGAREGDWVFGLGGGRAEERDGVKGEGGSRKTDRGRGGKRRSEKLKGTETGKGGREIKRQEKGHEQASQRQERLCLAKENELKRQMAKEGRDGAGRGWTGHNKNARGTRQEMEDEGVTGQ